MRRRNTRARAPGAPAQEPLQASIAGEDELQPEQPRRLPPAGAKCRCGAPRAAGKLFCAPCFELLSKLWTTANDPDVGLCRRVE